MGIYVVTGGAGFIGSNLVHRLVRDGHEVRVVDDFSTGCRKNLQGVPDRIALFEGDVCDARLLARACEGAEVIFHQAAIPSVPRSIENPVATTRAGVEGTVSVLETARRLRIRRVVFASSSSVYGDSPTLPKRETDVGLSPVKSPYAASKLAGELYCGVYHNVLGVETVCLRYFNVFGPRQDPKSFYAAVIPIFIRCALTGRPATVHGDGEQTRDFTYVDNVVEANLLAATAPGAAGAVVNIGCGERFSLNRLLDEIGALLGRRVERTYGPERAGDVRHSLAEIARARAALGYEPKVSFREGLRRTLDWIRDEIAADGSVQGPAAGGPPRAGAGR